jgi:glycosyltransferase involved in cell wall biosynthesis
VKFSIVIPTQDRSKLLSVVVKHAMQLDHPDFEVIVSDNSTTAERRERNLEAVGEYAGAPNFRIVHPPRVMSPPAHFEFALEHATGDYVTYLTDKMVVFEHALSDVEAVIEASEPDIVNWACAQYRLEDPDSPLGSGILVEEFEFLDGRPEAYDPIAALRVKARGAAPREKQDRRDFVLGKIVFGCYSRELIDRIRSRSGTVFDGATHDYSAMTQALSLARTCVMLNAYEAIFFSLPRAQSLGSATATEPQRALQYYRTFTDADSLLASLPVPGVYASQHNMVAHDYKKFLPIYGNGRLFNERNWTRAIATDLLSESMVWLNPAEKTAQVGLFRSHVKRPGYLLATELRLRGAELRSSMMRTRDRILDRHQQVTGQEFSAATLEQAMAHVLSEGRERQVDQEATADAAAALRLGLLLDGPVKLVMSLVLALRTPQLRALLWRCLADAIVHPATASSLPSVLEDLLKLAIVHRIRGAKLRRLSQDVEVTVERSPAEVVMRSLPAENPPNISSKISGVSESRNGDVAALRRVTWDHSAIGSDIYWPLPKGRSIRVSIGEPGRHVHEFRSLPRLAARFPVQTARALP